MIAQQDSVLRILSLRQGGFKTRRAERQLDNLQTLY